MGLSRADVLAVSSKGELAVLLKKTGDPSGGWGTLARIPVEGGTPREVLENVGQADWSPNGEDLAVVVKPNPDVRYQLQYPIGTVIGEADWFRSIRVSPKGDLVAYFGQGDKAGTGAIKTIDRKGKRHIISNGWRGEDLLAWSPRGDEIIFSAGRGSHDSAIRAVSLLGHERVLLPNPLGLSLHDVASDGRLLVEHVASRGGIACKPRGETRERELGRQDWSVVRAISKDGKLVVFAEQGEASDSGVYLRKTDGSPAIRLGDASWASDLSSDGQWVLCIQNGPPPYALLIPTGPGTAKRIPLDGIPTAGGFLPNGKEFAVSYKDKDGRATNFIIGIDGGKPKRIRPDIDSEIMTDGIHVTYGTKDGRIRVGSVSGAPDKTVTGAPLGPNDEQVGGSADGRFLYLWRKGEVPAPVDRLELATGRREPWMRLMPEDSAGITQIGPVILADEGRSYAYSYQRILMSDLYVVDGVK